MKGPNLCIICKSSRALCGQEKCPLLAKIEIAPKFAKISQDFFGPSPSIFVGRIGYPRVNIGPMAMFEPSPEIDNPQSWFGMDYSKVIEFRSLLIRSKSGENIFSKSRFIEEIQELALASTPTDVELKFRKKPVYRVSFSDVTQPMGPSASLEKMKITENPKIEKKVDKIVSDELKAGPAVHNLYNIDLDVYKITTILSSGALGLEENQKLVPTRWSITAIDDIIAKDLIEKIKEYPSVNELQVYESQYLDNHFLVLLIPGNWEFENFEAWSPGSFWSQSLKDVQIAEEYESYKGRTKYAETEGGGYYASRLGVVEALHNLKRQARVVVFREVYEGYTIPLGVWVVRETVRNSFKNEAMKFSTMAEALSHIDSKLRLNISEFKKKSKILKQKRLTDFHA